MTTLHLRKSIGRSLWRRGSLLAALVFAVACPALAPCARATCEQGCDTTHNNTFLGNDALLANTTGTFNTATGGYALAGNTTGSDNTASGFDALYKNTTGTYNTADGAFALEFNTTGSGNTASGQYALGSNTTGGGNTANGVAALYNNTTGGDNTATGVDALYSNTNGYYNTANGFYALLFNTTGSNNTASGQYALNSNTTGNNNTATGVSALYNNTIGDYNTAQGAGVLAANTNGIDNTAIGVAALSANTTGGNNSATGVLALQSNTTGSNNIALGSLAGANLTTGSNNIDIGNAGVAAESNIIRIGTSGTQTATFIAGIRGVAVAGGQPVAVNASGQLGIRPSTARFKENIKPMDNASEALLLLEPVTFRYKKELDPGGVPQFGLMAEEVAKVAADLVTMDDQGKPLTVRYEEVNAMLLNEFLKEHRKVEEQSQEIATEETTIGRLETAMAQQRKDFQATATQQEKEIKALVAGLQKVSNQRELTKHVARVAANYR